MSLTTSRADGIIRTAAWFYVARRVITGVFILIPLALAVLLVLGTVTRSWLLSLMAP